MLSNRREKIEVVIDTGFSGFLVPPHTPTLSAFSVRNEVTLIFISCMAKNIGLTANQAGPSVGMSLLYGSRVVLDVIDDGDVSINALH